MPLKDFYCTGCDSVSADHLVALECTELTQPCPKCRAETAHRVLCNTRAPRVRINDFPDDPKFYRGQTQVTGFSATYVDPKTKQTKELAHCHRGDAMTDDQYFGNDATAERRDRMQHDTDRERGTLPLVFDRTAQASG